MAARVPAEGVDVGDVGGGDALEELQLVVGNHVEGALRVRVVRLEEVLVVEVGFCLWRSYESCRLRCGARCA